MKHLLNCGQAAAAMYILYVSGLSDMGLIGIREIVFRVSAAFLLIAILQIIKKKGMVKYGLPDSNV